MADRLADRLTVVLLTHDCAHRLAPILDRLTELGVPLLAVDNASRDDTRAVLADRGIATVALPRNIGAAARNIGAEHARTPYVAFCDDDGWYERPGLDRAVELLDRHPRLALVNARILVEPDGELDPICAEMEQSPLPDHDGMPGAVLLGFMAGAVVVRVVAYLEAGGYDPRFFMGGEEETLAMKLARRGWRMRYVPDVVVRHRPSVANAPFLRPYGMRNTLWNCWLHRRAGSALRWTLFTLADVPKNRDWVRGVAMTARGLPWVLRHRSPMPPELDRQFRRLDERRFRARRPLLNRHDPLTAR